MRPSLTPIVTPLQKSYLQLLDDCIQIKHLLLGSQTHSRIITSGLQLDSFLSTKLITLYSLCDHLPSAEAVFTRSPICNVFLLNAMIRGYTSNGLYQEAINVFHRKRAHHHLHPDSYTFSSVLKACASLSDLAQGRQLHKLAMESGFGSNVFVSNSLISMFAKCGALEDAVHVFDSMPQRDVVSWNSVISAYAVSGCDSETVLKVREMAGCGFKPDQVTVVSALSLPCVAENGDSVREVHGYVLRNGYGFVSMIRNALVSAYGNCGVVEAASRVFNCLVPKDRVTWNAMISCYAENGLFEESMSVLRDMKLSEFDADVVTYSGIISSLSQNNRHDEAVAVFEEMLFMGLKPDAVAIASVLPAISGRICFGYCKEIHACSYRNKLEPDRRVRNALVSVYSKCSSIRHAEQVFETIDNKDIISWSSMVVGYVQNEYFIEAVDTFRRMIRAKMEPNPITVTGILSACASASGLRLGKELHMWAVKNAFEGQSFVGSALVDMYARCGRIKDSRRVFDLMEDRNLVTWNSMIGGYAIHGLGDDALKIFRMIREPDQVSFIAALSACSHAGLVEEGIDIFNSMKDFRVTPREGHYVCMVDLLGRSGRVNQALDLVSTMPMKPSTEILGALLGACKIHSNLEIGIYMGEKIVESGSDNSGYYVLLSNIFADYGRWGDVVEMRKLMQERGVRKGAGWSWIEVNDGIYSFVAKDLAQYPDQEILLWVLGVLSVQMRGTSC